MATSTRDRIVAGSAELFRRQGYSATGLKQIASSASAPFGSLYHHFPGGKEQLGEDVIRWSGSMYLQLFLTIAAESSDVISGVKAFFDGAAETLRETDYADACPIAAVALEVASTNEPMRQATAEVFETWIAALADYFVAAGIRRARARELALSTLSLLEGAFIFSRAMRSTTPVQIAGKEASAAVRDALAAAGVGRRSR